MPFVTQVPPEAKHLALLKLGLQTGVAEGYHLVAVGVGVLVGGRVKVGVGVLVGGRVKVGVGVTESSGGQ